MIDLSTVEPLLEERLAKHAKLFRAFDLHAIIAALDAIPAREPYQVLGPIVNGQWARMKADFGVAGFEAFQQATLLTLIRDFDTRATGKGYVDDILGCFRFSFVRIIASIQDPVFDYYRTSNDILLKDLALCRQKMFPAGAQAVEPLSSFHRAIIYRGGIRQLFGVIRLLLQTGSNWPWYQIHTNLSEREEFNPDGWDLCYLRIAQMLVKHPKIKGMYGGSWFYDPAIEYVSPRLTYLRKRPQENGAYIFYSNKDLNGGALTTSPTRRSLFEKGEYLPKAYALIWPREPMIAWAKQFAADRDV